MELSGAAMWWKEWGQSAICLASGLAAGLIVRYVLLPLLTRLADTTVRKYDDLALVSVKPWIVFWGLLAGLGAAAGDAPIDPKWAGILQKAVLAAVLGTAALAAASMAARIFEYAAKEKGLTVGALGLTRSVLKGAVLLLGALVVLSNLGVSITPLITALGVGSLAVALALQDTLSNLFAGFHIIAAGQIRVGDYVQLDSGQAGYVDDIGWRSCQIRELPGNLIVVPNSKLAQAVVTNYDLPGKDSAVLVNVGVAYGSDLREVERVTCGVAAEVMKEVSGGVPEFAPFIRYNAFGDSAINFTVILRGSEFVDRYLVTHEFIKRLHARYRAEQIEIPFPQRVVTMAGPCEPDANRTERAR
jgi:small-conductance mechanosensitive channel